MRCNYKIHYLLPIKIEKIIKMKKNYVFDMNVRMLSFSSLHLFIYTTSVLESLKLLRWNVFYVKLEFYFFGCQLCNKTSYLKSITKICFRKI